jgi:hypothetical protein
VLLGLPQGFADAGRCLGGESSGEVLRDLELPSTSVFVPFDVEAVEALFVALSAVFLISVRWQAQL